MKPVFTLESIIITNPPVPDITLRPGEGIQIVTTMAFSDGTALPNTSTGYAWRTGKGLAEEALIPIFLLVYSSSNPAAVKVNLEEGLVRAVSPGTATITVNAVIVAPPGFMGYEFKVDPGATDSITVTVQPTITSTTTSTTTTSIRPVLTLESIIITNPPGHSVTLYITRQLFSELRERIQISSTLTFSDGFVLPNVETGTIIKTEQGDVPIFKLVYSSSNPEIAEVNLYGLVTAVSPGTATITVSAVVVAPPGFEGFDFKVSPGATDSILVTVRERK